MTDGRELERYTNLQLEYPKGAVLFTRFTSDEVVHPHLVDDGGVLRFKVGRQAFKVLTFAQLKALALEIIGQEINKTVQKDAGELAVSQLIAIRENLVDITGRGHRSVKDGAMDVRSDKQQAQDSDLSDSTLALLKSAQNAFNNPNAANHHKYNAKAIMQHLGKLDLIYAHEIGRVELLNKYFGDRQGEQFWVIAKDEAEDHVAGPLQEFTLTLRGDVVAVEPVIGDLEGKPGLVPEGYNLVAQPIALPSTPSLPATTED